MIENVELTPEQLEDLEVFIYKVSMDGYTYAKNNYFPSTLPNPMKRALRAADGEMFLDVLMQELGLEYS